jgi:Holliday junction resolvase
MPSIKAKKGNPFEYDTAYSMIEGGYDVVRLNDNTKSLDLIASNPSIKYHIECKNRQRMSWKSIQKIWDSIKKTPDTIPLVIFKSNFQPTLVFNGSNITTFEDFFKIEWKKRPKKYKLWRQNDTT